MKKTFLIFGLILNIASAKAQGTICNPSGNLIIFTNYDGGILNINVNVNIPNLKIGIVSYEGVTVYLTGTYVSNVTGVAYAGFNGSDVHCGSAINTSINGAPVSATTNISLYPASPLSNPNGYPSIICGYSCDITTNQGGCNTVDQINAYFLNYFPGSVIYAHQVQYGCWTATQPVSNVGNCCLTSVGINNETSDNAISIFPNPATDKLLIESTEKITGIKCMNTLGIIINLKSENNSTDISCLADGMYYLSITTASGKIIIKKFVKD
jgi:hypothetical protein